MKTHNTTSAPAASVCQPDAVRGAACSHLPQEPKLSVQAKTHTSNRLARLLWIARFHPVWIWDFSRACLDDAGACLDQFRAMQWFMQPYRIWVRDWAEYLHAARQKEWASGGQASCSSPQPVGAACNPSGQKQQTSTVSPAGNSSAPLAPEAACVAPVKHALAPPAIDAGLPRSHRSGASSSRAASLDAGSPESSLHDGSLCMMGASGSAGNADVPASHQDAVRSVLFRAVSNALGCSNGEGRRHVRAGNIRLNGLMERDENRAVVSGDNVTIISRQYGIQSFFVETGAA